MSFGSFAGVMVLLQFLNLFTWSVAWAASPNICADFHAAICGKPDKAKAVVEDIKLIQAMDIGAKQMGAASAEAYVREKLKDVSIKLPRKIKLADVFKAMASTGEEQEGDKIEITEDPEVCMERVAKIGSAEISARMVKMYERGIPEFFALHLLDRCPKSKAGTRFCKDAPRVRREGVEVFRSQNLEAAKAFVRKYYRVNKDPEILCQENSMLEMFTIGRIVDQARTDLLTARGATEFLYGFYYLPQTRVKLEGVFADTKLSVTKLLQTLIPDEAKRNAYLAHYKRVDVSWPEISDLNFESRADGHGQRIRAANLASGGIYDFSEALRDPDSDFFGPGDAEYRDPVLQGRYGSSFPNVVLFPRMLKSFETEPDTVAATVAHELGHAIGPEVSEEFGFSLSAEWKDLLDCYADREGSIGMRDDQKDETIADYVSAEFIADKLNELPAGERVAYLKRAAKDMCDMEGNERQVMYDDAHPDSYLRINGILGANPRVREALGCVNAHPRFKTCGLGTREGGEQLKLTEVHEQR